MFEFGTLPSEEGALKSHSGAQERLTTCRLWFPRDWM